MEVGLCSLIFRLKPEATRKSFRLKPEATGAVNIEASSNHRQIALDRGGERGVAVLEGQLARIGCPADSFVFSA